MGMFFPIVGLVYSLIIKKEIKTPAIPPEPADQDEYADRVFKQANIRMKLEEAADQFRQGIITREEFEAEKNRLLDEM